MYRQFSECIHDMNSEICSGEDRFGCRAWLEKKQTVCAGIAMYIQYNLDITESLRIQVFFRYSQIVIISRYFSRLRFLFSYLFNINTIVFIRVLRFSRLFEEVTLHIIFAWNSVPAISYWKQNVQLYPAKMRPLLGVKRRFYLALFEWT